MVRSRLRQATVVVLALATVGCADEAVVPASTPYGLSAAVSSTHTPSAGTQQIIALAGAAFDSPDREDIISLLGSAETVTDEEQRFQAYLGVWQLMRRSYQLQGQRPQQKEAMDAVERVAQTSRFYAKDLFRLEKK